MPRETADDLDAPVDPGVGVIPTERLGYLPANVPGVLRWLAAEALSGDDSGAPQLRAAESEGEAFLSRSPSEFAYRRVAPGCWFRWDGARVASCWTWAPSDWVERGDIRLDAQGRRNLHRLGMPSRMDRE
jgi:hypothetical protein